jgi:hypothetical protein
VLSFTIPQPGPSRLPGGNTRRYGCNATLLGNGKVLIVGDPAPYGRSASAQLYDPSPSLFSPSRTYADAGLAQLDCAASLGPGVWDCPQATRLADGRVLTAGAVAAEAYDPIAATVSLTGTLTSYRIG